MKSVKIKIIVIVVMLIIVAGILLWNISSKEQKYGNTEGNIVNSFSQVTSDGAESYIALHTGIYKGSDIQSLTKITEGEYAYVNYMDGWLYAREKRKNEIIKKKTEETSKVILYQGKEATSGPWVVNNAIFFKELEKNSAKYFQMRVDGGAIRETKPKWGDYDQWIYTYTKSRDYEYDLLVKGYDLAESQHANNSVYVFGRGDTSLQRDENLYRFTYGKEEGELLEEGVFQFNISDDTIYYLTRGENTNILLVMRMTLEGTEKKKIAEISLEDAIERGSLGVGNNILYIAADPKEKDTVRFLVDIESGEYVKVEEDDTLIKVE